MALESYTIQLEDVGRRFLRVFGRTWDLASVMGPIQPQDVGKRIYLNGGVLSVENQEQFEARLPRTNRRFYTRRRCERRT